MEGEGNGEAEGWGEGVISENSEDKLRGRGLAWEARRTRPLREAEEDF